MRRVWISVFALSAIFLWSLYYVNHQQKNTAEIIAHLQEITEEPIEQDKEQTQEKIKHIIDIWDDNLEGWILLFGKDKVEAVTISLHKLPLMYGLEMYDEYVLEVKEVVVHIQNMWAYQWINLRGIY